MVSLRLQIPASASCLAHRGNGMSCSEAHRKLVVVSAADYCSLVGILSHPDDSFGVHKDFHAVDVFKHYKLHDASFSPSLGALFRNLEIVQRFGRL
jgi:hypothetical protein